MPGRLCQGLEGKELVNTSDCLQQREKGLFAGKGEVGGMELFQEGEKAGKLYFIAKALLSDNQQGASVQIFALPEGEGELR